MQRPLLVSSLFVCTCLFGGHGLPGGYGCDIPVILSEDQVKGTYVGYSETELFFYRVDLNVDKESRFIIVVNPGIQLSPKKEALLKPVIYRIKSWSVNGARISFNGESDNPKFRQVAVEGTALPPQSIRIVVSGDALGAGGKTVLLGESNLKKAMEITAKLAQEAEGSKPVSSREGETNKKPIP